MRQCYHFWEPIPGWSGRYRCKYCKAIGYRQAAVLPEALNGGMIIPYRCQFKNCEAHAQVANKHGEKRCFEHWKQRRKSTTTG